MIQPHPTVIKMGGVKWDIEMTRQAERSARQYNESMRRSVRLPKQLSVVSELAAEKAIHIFNVGPFTDTVFLGTWGTVQIPACPADKEWIYVCEIPAVYVETIPGEEKYNAEQIEGQYIAQCILNEGPELKNTSGRSRRQIGVFIGSVTGPKGASPKPEEIAAAKESLNQHLHELVSEATTAHDLGPAEAQNTISSKHRIAAQILGREDLGWVPAKTPERQQPCPNCGAKKNPQYPTCQKCGHKDQALYDKLFGSSATPPPSSVKPPLKQPGA